MSKSQSENRISHLLFSVMFNVMDKVSSPRFCLIRPFQVEHFWCITFHIFIHITIKMIIMIFFFSFSLSRNNCSLSENQTNSFSRFGKSTGSPDTKVSKNNSLFKTLIGLIILFENSKTRYKKKRNISTCNRNCKMDQVQKKRKRHRTNRTSKNDKRLDFFFQTT
jgi:hypothetical protein